MRIKHLTHTAISLALIFISFMLFRGSTNLVNAITVPLVLYINYKKFSIREYITLVLMTLIFSFLFFFQQLFFIFLYAFLGIFMAKIFQKNYGFYYRTAVFTLIFSLGFSITLNLTDLVLGTALQQMLFSIMSQNISLMILFYLFNSLIVSLALNFLTPQIEKKIVMFLAV